MTDPAPPDTAEALRTALTDQLCRQGTIRSPRIAAAFRTTPRHLFLPGVALPQAYADRPIYTKADTTGATISAATRPTIVATMLEQLQAHPGDRILEIGAGTGYNAALLATIVGPGGQVTTVDLDADLADGARAQLAAAGIDHVEVVCADGVLGHPAAAPYTHIIATVGIVEIPRAWLAQLTPTGRLVVPLRLRGTTSRSIAFQRQTDGWVSVDSQLAVFMPLRGIDGDTRRIIPLSPEVSLQVYTDQHADVLALAGVLDTPRRETWTGVRFPANVAFEWMDLWLALHLDNALMRMNVQPHAVATGQVTPMFDWGSMATTRGTDLAYLTTRPGPPAADGGARREVGVIGHGPTSRDLVDQITDAIRTWDADYRRRTVRFELPDTPEASNPTAARFVLTRPHQPITVIWD